MAKKQLTREQLLAFARDRHISVTANAGSGKTTVLIDKFIDILLNDKKVALDPTRILAITFTRVAAAEMFLRAAKAIDKFISVETVGEKLKILYEVREKLSYAKISTIHSFCSSLLRDFPIEAGVAPNFAELGEFDKSRLMDQSIENVIDSKLTDSVGNNDFRDLFDNYGLAFVKTMLQSIITKPDIFYELKKIYYQTDAEINHFYRKKINGFVIGIIAELIIYIEQTTDLPEKREQLEKFYYLSDAVGRVFNELKDADEITSEEILNLIKLLSEKIGRSYFVNYVGKHTNKTNETASIMEKLKSLVSFDDFYDNLLLIKTARLFIELADDFFFEYNSAKEEMGAIDYDDMIFRVREMLKDEETARLVRSEYDYILVDEFQDTNIAQYEIVKALVPELENPSAPLDLRSFIVGDGKQSIYGFRGADVRVFLNAIDNIKEFNSDKVKNGIISEDYHLPLGADFNPELHYLKSETDNERFGNLNLSCSFRLLPVVAAWVNTVFNEIEPMSPSQFDVEYENLVCGRDTDRLFPQESLDISQDYELGEEFGTVSVILNLKKFVDKSEESGSSDYKETSEGDFEFGNSEDDESDEAGFSSDEAQMTANHIAKIVTEETEYMLNVNGTMEKPTFGDIAVLARNRKGFSPLVTAFLNNQIPYEIQSGKGFFASQEIIDLTEFLVFLSNEQDNLAVASILKSPFFGFTNEDLFEISLAGKRSEPFYYKFLTYSGGLSPEDRNHTKCLRAIDIFTRMKFYSTRIPLSSLISKIIDTGGYWGVAAKSPAGSQIEANFEKFIQNARDFEAKGFKTLNDFIEEVHHLFENSGEAEAVQPTGENAVKIVTIHGAKGAEFPIVYLYSTNSGSKGMSAPFLDDTYGIAFNLRTRTSPEVTEENNIISLLAKDNLRQANEAEERRIFYVAMTRARDHLIITGEVKENPKTGFRSASGFLKYILQTLSIDVKTDITFDLSSKIKFDTLLTILHKGAFVPINVRFDVSFSTENIDTTKLEEISKVNSEKILMLDPIIGTFQNGIYSASRLQDFLADDDKYYQKTLLALETGNEKRAVGNFLTEDLPQNLREPKDSDEFNQTLGNSAISLFGSVPGTIIHFAFENISLWANPGGKADALALSEIIDKQLLYYNLIEAEELKTRIITECLAIAESAFFQKNIKYILAGKPEISLTMPLGDDFFTGTFDLLLQNEKGEMEIWDWKSNRIHTAEDKEYLENHYFLQMESYALMLMFLYPGQSEYVTRLVFTNRAPFAEKDEDFTATFVFSEAQRDDIYYKLNNLMKSTYLV